MAQEDTMISATTTPKRLSYRSASSNQYLTELFSRCYLTPTNIYPSSPSSSRRRCQNLYSSEHSYPSRGLTGHSETTSSCPSPPSADLHSGSHSLFPLQIDLEPSNRHSCHPSTVSCYFGGILDSPVVVTHPFLNYQAPLSPPLTLPTSTMSLPLAESETEAYLPSPLSQTHDLPDQEHISYSPPPLLDALTPNSQSSSSTLQSPPPLSPVSPTSSEWFSQAFSSPSSGPESFGGKIGDGLPSLFANPGCHSFHDESLAKAGLASLPDFPASSLLNFQQLDGPDVRLIDNNPFFSPALCESPKSIDEASLDPIDLEDNLFSPFSVSPSSPDFRPPFVSQAPAEYSHEAEQTARQPRPEGQKPEQHPVPPVFHPTFSPSVRNSSLPELDDLGDSDLDFPDSLVDLAPPPSPSRRGSFAELPDDDLDLRLGIPRITRDTSDDTLMLSPPESPGLALQSLPGADTDEDLIPVELASPNRTPDHLPVLRPHLLIVEDDSTLHPSTSRRSLSPEPCDTLDVNMIDSRMSGDDELRRMCGVMKRTKEREGAAKSMESILEEEERVIRSISRSSDGKNGDVDEAWSKLIVARRKSRRLKEKVRETATLLRLKLAERGWKTEKDTSGKSILVLKSPATPPSPTLETEDAMKLDPPPKGPIQKRLRITNPQQLLVKMLMDRQELQYSPSGRAGSPSRGTISPLSRTSISAADLQLDDGTISDGMDMLDVEMRHVDEEESTLDMLDMNMEVTGHRMEVHTSPSFKNYH